MKLEGKTALITGGSTGIGREIVRLFSKEGAQVGVNYLNTDEEASSLKAELDSARPGQAELFQADVTKEDEVQEMIRKFTERFGHLDILVCSAGINHQVSVEHMEPAQWDRMIACNLRSVYLCCHYVLPHMLSQGFGRIINITSQLGQIGGVDSAHYSAAKAGIIGFTKSLAREVSTRGVNANCIAPGPIKTPFFYEGCTPKWQADKLASLPLGRFGEPWEVAPAALFLASDPDGNLFTGQTLGPNSGDVML